MKNRIEKNSIDKKKILTFIFLSIVIIIISVVPLINSFRKKSKELPVISNQQQEVIQLNDEDESNNWEKEKDLSEGIQQLERRPKNEVLSKDKEKSSVLNNQQQKQSQLEEIIIIQKQTKEKRTFFSNGNKEEKEETTYYKQILSKKR